MLHPIGNKITQSHKIGQSEFENFYGAFVGAVFGRFLPKTSEKRELLFRKNMSFLSEKAKAIPKLQEQNVFHKFLVVLKAK